MRDPSDFEVRETETYAVVAVVGALTACTSMLALLRVAAYLSGVF